MAVRLEKEPNGKQAIVIDGWANGIAPDPYSGMGAMLGVDLETNGEVAVGYPITVSTISGGTLGIPIARSTGYFTSYQNITTTGLAQRYAILDAGGQVFQSTSISGTFTLLSSSNSTSGSTSNDGIAFWLGYLFKTRGANIDYWNGSTWSTGWQTSLSTGVKHYMYVASDDNLYITNGNFLARVFAPTPSAFDPGNTATFNFNTQILEIPVNDVAISLAEVGGGSSPQSTLLIGGSQNAIYPWDKISSSFSLPIYVADSYIGLMVSANQNAFIFPGFTGTNNNAGGRGRVYITNGSQADLYYKIPDYIYGIQDPYFIWFDAIFHRNNLIMAFRPQGNTGLGIANSTTPPYVWALDLTTQTSTTTLPTKVFRAISPLAADANINYPTVLIPNGGPGFGFMVGYTEFLGSTSSVGYSGTAAGTGTASILTDLIPVGTFLQKKTFSQIEFKLRSPLLSGESISITPVIDTIAGSALTFSPSVTTGSISGVAPINFTGAQWLQLSIAMTGNGTTSGVRLMEIRIR